MAINTEAVTPAAKLALVKIDADIERLRLILTSQANSVVGVENAASLLWKTGCKIQGLEAAAQFIRDAEKELLEEKKEKPEAGASGGEPEKQRGPYEN